MSQPDNAPLENSPKLMDLVTPQTGQRELQQLVAHFISPEDEKILGGTEQSIIKVASSVIFSGIFAPLPGTLKENTGYR